MTREELELHNKWAEIEERFVKAKLADRDSDEYRAAKAEMNDMRVYWRQIREAVAEQAEGVAAPEAIKAKKG